jgi:hypothetical protein
MSSHPELQPRNYMAVTSEGANMTPKGRPTYYRGCLMRSRIEGQSAAALDAEGIGWKYEPHAYGSRQGQYLPDFQLERPPRLANRPWFLEIKGARWDRRAARDHMGIIKETWPDAVLLIMGPGEFHYNLGEGWNVYLLDGPPAPEDRHDEPAGPPPGDDRIRPISELVERFQSIMHRDNADL